MAGRAARLWPQSLQHSRRLPLTYWFGCGPAVRLAPGLVNWFGCFGLVCWFGCLGLSSDDDDHWLAWRWAGCTVAVTSRLPIDPDWARRWEWERVRGGGVERGGRGRREEDKTVSGGRRGKESTRAGAGRGGGGGAQSQTREWERRRRGSRRRIKPATPPTASPHSPLAGPSASEGFRPPARNPAALVRSLVRRARSSWLRGSSRCSGSHLSPAASRSMLPGKTAVVGFGLVASGMINVTIVRRKGKGGGADPDAIPALLPA